MPVSKRMVVYPCFILLLILTAAAILRVVGIDFGLPMAYHNDEPVLVLACQQFFSGDFNPHNFLYPSLLMYFMHAVQRIYFVLAGGPVDLTMLYLLSRLTVAAFGIGCVIFVFLLGKKLAGSTAGLAAALLLSLSPLHVIHSHYATTDVPLSFFVLWSIYQALNLEERGRWCDYILTGLAAGLTVSIKIPGAAVFVPILIAHLIRIQRLEKMNLLRQCQEYYRRWPARSVLFLLPTFTATAAYLFFKHFAWFADRLLRRIPVDLWQTYHDEIVSHLAAAAGKYALLFGGGLLLIVFIWPIWRVRLGRLFTLFAVALVAFFASTPYAIIDFKQFAHDFLFQMVVSQTTWSGTFADKAPALVTNFGYLLGDFGPVLLFFVVLAAVRTIIQKDVPLFLFFSFGLFYYFYLGTWKLMFDRYMVPLLPILAVLAAVGFVWVAVELASFLCAKWRIPRWCTYGSLTLLLFVPPAFSMGKEAVDFDRYLLKKNTRTLAFEWATANLPRQAKILREQYAPEIEIDGFDVININFMFNDSVDADYVYKNKIDYLIVTDKLWSRPMQEDGVVQPRSAYQRIVDYADLLWSIAPTPANPGPEIHIYRIRYPDPK